MRLLAKAGLAYIFLAGACAWGPELLVQTSLATPCIIRLRRTKMLVLQTVFVRIGTVPASRTPREQWLFHKTGTGGRGPSGRGGLAKVSVKGCVSPENNNERNSEE